MKKFSLAFMVCVAALGVACNGSGNQRDNNGSPAAGQQSASSDDHSLGSATAGISGAAGTSGISADQSTSSQSGQSSAAQGGQTTGSSVSGAGSGDVQQFVRQAAESGMAEVQLGQLAQKRAMNAQVKEFAGMMVRDHTKANNELKQTAQAQKIQIPTEVSQKHKDEMQRLQQLQGAEFDREYMRLMVDSHMEARDMLDARAGSSGSANRSSSGAAGATANGSSGTSATGTSGRSQSDAAVNQWASKTLPTVEHHLQQAQQLSTRVQTSGSGASSTGAGSSSSGSGRTSSGTSSSGGSSSDSGSSSGSSGSGSGSTRPAPGSGSGTGSGGSGR